MTTMLIAKRSLEEGFSTSLRKTRKTLKATADRAVMLQQFRSLRYVISASVKIRIKEALLLGEAAIQEFLGPDGKFDLEELYETTLTEIASLVPTQKADKIFRKWFGGSTEREIEIGLEVFYQMGYESTPCVVLDLPSCLYRLSSMGRISEAYDAQFTLEDAKELCQHWTQLRPNDRRYELNITMKEMTRTAHRMMEAFHDCQKQKHGRVSFIFDRRLR